MDKNYQNMPGGFQPMAPQDFNARLEGAVQQDMLLNPGKITEQRLAMDRAAHKSCLRMNECAAKQMMKIKKDNIVYQDNKILRQIFDGTDRKLDEQILFKCIIKGVLRYKREKSKKIYWQMVLSLDPGGEEIFSPLYEDEVLKSVCKLQKTVLIMYECTTTQSAKSLAWKYVHKILMQMFEKSDIKEIPSRAGWYKFKNGWWFYTAEKTNSLFHNEQIKEFHSRDFGDLNTAEVIKSILKDVEKASNTEYIGGLLILRLFALLGRFMKEGPLGVCITIVGEEAKDIAEKFLRTMENDVDIANLDSDNISSIKKQAKSLRDTPLILRAYDPDNKSTQNRIKTIMSWAENGYLEQVEITIPFVFCISSFSKHYPLNKMIVFDADKIKFPTESMALEKLQYLIVSKIEESGEYWRQRLQKGILVQEKYWRIECVGETYMDSWRPNAKLVSMMDRIVSVMLEMFRNELDKADYDMLQKLLYSGHKEISRQFSMRGDMLVELFKEEVIRCVDRGIVHIVNVNKTPRQGKPHIYYDQKYYYFVAGTWEVIMKQMKTDNKSILYIKQQLIDQEMVKLYKHTGVNGRDLNVDFRVYSGWKEDYECISGFAINRMFWDEIGSIALAERGIN